MGFPVTAVFWCSVLGILYVLILYPALLDLAARLRPRAIRPMDPAPTPAVTVLLPVRNGERFLAAKLDSLLALDYPRERVEILIISDGSTDGTAAIAHSYASRGVRLIDRPGEGKWAALNHGLAASTGEVVFFTDVRQAVDPRCLLYLTAALSDPAVGAVSGELIIRDGTTNQEADIGAYWRYEKWIRRRQSRLHSVPGVTGCVYAMRRTLARPLPPDTLLDDVHQPLGAFFAGYRVVFEERARVFDYPSSLAAEFHRKVRTLAGVYQVTAAYPAVLWPGHALWIHWLSHKLGRLALPFLLLAVLATSWALPSPWRESALAGQALGYGLAAVDPLLGAGHPLKRLSSPLRTFFVLMLAALCAASIAFRPARSFWTPTRLGAEKIA